MKEVLRVLMEEELENGELQAGFSGKTIMKIMRINQDIRNFRLIDIETEETKFECMFNKSGFRIVKDINNLLHSEQLVILDFAATILNKTIPEAVQDIIKKSPADLTFYNHVLELFY